MQVARSYLLQESKKAAFHGGFFTLLVCCKPYEFSTPLGFQIHLGVDMALDAAKDDVQRPWQDSCICFWAWTSERLNCDTSSKKKNHTTRDTLKQSPNAIFRQFQRKNKQTKENTFNFAPTTSATLNKIGNVKMETLCEQLWCNGTLEMV